MSGTRQSWSSSGSENDQRYAGIDEKKRKRMISNRESARRSRMKKQKRVEELTLEVGRLQAANSAIVGRIDDISKKYEVMAIEKSVLKAQEVELSERLKYLNDVMKNTGVGDSGNAAADPLMTPWQILFPKLLPIPASSGLFKF
ncbi:PREDICTED: bZIP transcription factor 53-like [Ipomoea nil]|uniref:bZIP transcription factor 53-like n=1 Tax=Ipomoea nil TaxID=35883 RepID=UPI0009010629|nr:PREDICTED: bZIP transcription factor 53-like [Ipomoea nil]